MRHIASFAVGAAAVMVIGCASPRNIREPVEGAVVVTLPDSARWIYDATIDALNDEPIRIALTDRGAGLIETAYIDLTSVRLPVNMADLPTSERLVKFRFRTRTTFGATNLIAEVMGRRPGGGAANERMLPPDHPSRVVLMRLIEGIRERLAERRDP